MHLQDRFEEARSKALRAIDTFDKLGVVKDAEKVSGLLREINYDARATRRTSYSSWIG